MRSVGLDLHQVPDGLVTCICNVVAVYVTYPVVYYKTWPFHIVHQPFALSGVDATVELYLSPFAILNKFVS